MNRMADASMHFEYFGICLTYSIDRQSFIFQAEFSAITIYLEVYLDESVSEDRFFIGVDSQIVFKTIASNCQTVTDRLF